jgi:twitching motility protein PilT
MSMAELLTMGVKQGASDLHIAAGMPPLLRIDGDLLRMQDMSIMDAATTKDYIYSVMNKDQQSEFETALEIDFATAVAGIARYRVNAFHQANGPAAVFRVIPEKIPTLDQLEMPPVFKELLSLPNGLILVTGPTGSGKSTTLAAMVQYINANQSNHIITIEDPIEFTHASAQSLINQREIHRDTHDFAAALRSALREDPDVILLGEMRDLETIRW